MDSPWVRRDTESDRFRDWFILKGSGGSMRRARTPIPLTKRMAWTMEVESYDDGTKKRQTVEVSRGRVIVQSRGKFNAWPAPREIEMLRRWAPAERL
jgi:hypothetical protein